MQLLEYSQTGTSEKLEQTNALENYCLSKKTSTVQNTTL